VWIDPKAEAEAFVQDFTAAGQWVAYRVKAMTDLSPICHLNCAETI
jgi:hypothetical protein